MLKICFFAYMVKCYKLVLPVFICLLLITSCKKDRLTITFNVTDSFDFTVKSGSVINLPIELLTPDIATNSEGEFEQNDTRADKINEINLNELKLTITSPTGKTFSFLKSIEIFISAEGLIEKLLASAYDVNSSSSSLNLNCSGDDIAEYIKKDSYKVRVKTVTRESLTQDVAINSFLSFKVKAAPLK
jgi:hypothetical protein